MARSLWLGNVSTVADFFIFNRSLLVCWLGFFWKGRPNLGCHKHSIRDAHGSVALLVGDK